MIVWDRFSYNVGRELRRYNAFASSSTDAFMIAYFATIKLKESTCFIKVAPSAILNEMSFIKE